MENYTWAVNKVKLQRAIQLAGVDPSEEAVKEMYIKLGGLIDEDKLNKQVLQSIKEAVVLDNPSVTITKETIAVPTEPVSEKVKKVVKRVTKKTK